MFDAYDAVILAYGAEGEKQLHVDELQPGAKNFFSARSFVGWYNGLPNSSNLPVDLSRVETAAIFGHGNVALDIARILLSSPDKLAKTDISAKSLDMLRRSSVKKVYLIGRRGPLQVSFTIKELREMINLKNSFTTHITSEFFQLLKEPEIIEKISRPRRRLTQLMMEVAIGTRAGDARNQLKQFHIKFLRSPVKILITESGQINGVQVFFLAIVLNYYILQESSRLKSTTYYQPLAKTI